MTRDVAGDGPLLPGISIDAGGRLVRDEAQLAAVDRMRGLQAAALVDGPPCQPLARAGRSSR